MEEYFVIILGNIFVFLHTNTPCGYSLEVPHQVASNEYPQYMFFMKKLKKIIPELSQNILP